MTHLVLGLTGTINATDRPLTAVGARTSHAHPHQQHSFLLTILSPNTKCIPHSHPSISLNLPTYPAFTSPSHVSRQFTGKKSAEDKAQDSKMEVQREEYAKRGISL